MTKHYVVFELIFIERERGLGEGEVYSCDLKVMGLRGWGGSSCLFSISDFYNKHG